MTEDTVCRINGEPVYEEEVGIAAGAVELAAQQKFGELSGQNTGKLDWSKEAEGRTGYEYLAEAVEEELIRMKVIQIEARKNGLCSEISYPEIEKQRQEENRQRARAKSEQEVVYGVVSFDEEEYYRYMIDNLDLQNKRYLTQEGILTVSGQEAEEKYAGDPSLFDNQPYESVSMFVEKSVLSDKYEDYMNQLEKAAEVKGRDRLLSFLEKNG